MPGSGSGALAQAARAKTAAEQARARIMRPR
jgi:hypothetical protein